MDRSESIENSKSVNQLVLTSVFLKNLGKFIFSVSVFSIFFSHNFCFPRFTLQLITHTVDKNYIFLLCNGLLVFLAKFSGSSTSCSSESSGDYRSFDGYKDTSGSESVAIQSEEELLGKEVTMDDEGTIQKFVDSTQEEEEREFVDAEDVEHQDTLLPFMPTSEEEEEDDDDDEEDEEDERSRVHLEQEEKITLHEENSCFLDEETIKSTLDEEDDDDEEGRKYEEEEIEFGEGNGILSAEELNKKFDEFIRKMKEDLRIEARRPLIMV